MTLTEDNRHRCNARRGAYPGARFRCVPRSERTSGTPEGYRGVHLSGSGVGVMRWRSGSRPCLACGRPWVRRPDSEMSPSPTDVGIQTGRYSARPGDPSRVAACAAGYFKANPNNSAGNGSLMRTPPVALTHLGDDQAISGSTVDRRGLGHINASRTFCAPIEIRQEFELGRGWIRARSTRRRRRTRL